jgi:hypothetical protein
LSSNIETPAVLAQSLATMMSPGQAAMGPQFVGGRLGSEPLYEKGAQVISGITGGPTVGTGVGHIP